MKLTQRQQRDLWGEDGPYSQVQLLTQERILDDTVTRTFLYIETSINPFTFCFIKKHRKTFSKDPLINLILDRAEYKGPEEGYFTVVFGEQLIDASSERSAKQALVDVRKAVIRMHQFVIDCFGEKEVQ